MPYYPTLAEDLARAKDILRKGKATAADVVGLSERVQQQIIEESGTIFGTDIYAAYKLLQSFVEALITVPGDVPVWKMAWSEIHPRSAEMVQDPKGDWVTKTDYIQLQQYCNQLQEWKDAVTDALVTDWVISEDNKDNPRKAINDLLVHAERLALDPAVSQQAAAWVGEIASLRVQLEDARKAATDYGLNSATQTLVLVHLTSALKKVLTPATMAEVISQCHKALEALPPPEIEQNPQQKHPLDKSDGI